MHNQSKTFVNGYRFRIYPTKAHQDNHYKEANMEKVLECRIGDLCIRRHSVWEESMIDMLREILVKAETGNKTAEDKLIDCIIQVIHEINYLSCPTYELQDTIKEAIDYLATKGVDIQSVLKTGKSANV
jgi:hypothetical protein